VTHDDGVWEHDQRHADLVRTRGADHPHTLRQARELADRLRDAGRSVDALALAEPAHTALADQFGADHPDALAAADTLASCYLAAGRPQQALVSCAIEDALRSWRLTCADTVGWHERVPVRS